MQVGKKRPKYNSVPYCKGSANRMKNQIYLDFSEVQPTFDEVKGSAIRMNCQILCIKKSAYITQALFKKVVYDCI